MRIITSGLITKFRRDLTLRNVRFLMRDRFAYRKVVSVLQETFTKQSVKAQATFHSLLVMILRSGISGTNQKLSVFAARTLTSMSSRKLTGLT